jgi:hypothetical protein
MRVRLLVALLAAILAVPGAASAIQIGQTAPDFLLEDIQTGAGFSLSDQAGKAVVVIFFHPT